MNYKVLTFCTLIFTALGFMSCGDDNAPADLDVNFKLEFDDTPLVGFATQVYPEGYNVFFTKYSLFMHNVTLTSPEGDHILSNVEWIDLLNNVTSEADALAGKSLSFSGVPRRAYTGLSFDIGVPSDINLTTPADYQSSSALSNNGEYWIGWTSYIFHKIEGMMDTDGDGEPDKGIALHIGSDDAFRSISIDLPLEINDAQEQLSVTFDLMDILNIDDQFYDFQETPQVHHLGVLPKVLPILDNLKAGLEVSLL
jgi:hypothetical protein